MPRPRGLQSPVRPPVRGVFPHYFIYLAECLISDIAENAA